MIRQINESNVKNIILMPIEAAESNVQFKHNYDAQNTE